MVWRSIVDIVGSGFFFGFCMVAGLCHINNKWEVTIDKVLNSFRNGEDSKLFARAGELRLCERWQPLASLDALSSLVRDTGICGLPGSSLVGMP